MSFLDIWSFKSIAKMIHANVYYLYVRFSVQARHICPSRDLEDISLACSDGRLVVLYLSVDLDLHNRVIRESSDWP